jgi:NAD(P)-dependent dehydrogenase (short-subunit alcohol dehydrogenase family)
LPELGYQEGKSMLLANRVAVITGGATGMGKAMAIKFAEEGCSIVISDISEDSGKKTAAEASQAGGEAIFVKCDVTHSGQVQDMTSAAIDKFGKIDILVNNAGALGTLWSLEEVTEEDWDRILDLNLKSVFLCCKAVVPHMKKNNYGRIVNISSMGAVSPPRPVVHYHAAKAGVLSLTQNLAMELVSFKIRVNAIVPGPIQTEYYEPRLRNMNDAQREAYFVTKGKTTPMQRMGRPEEIAAVALFLVTESSSYITGEAISVAGGLPLISVGI